MHFNGSLPEATPGDNVGFNVLNVETNIVSRGGFWQRFVMHFNGLDFSGQVGWSKGNNHSWFDDTSLNTTYWNCSNTSNFVYILKWETKRLVCGSGWWND